MKLYLAGPIRGYANHNFPAFYFAAKVLRDKGFDVFSPAEKGDEKELEANPHANEDINYRRRVFHLDTEYICDEADAVALLPGWEASSGAKAEKALAEAIGLKVYVIAEEWPDAVR